MTTVKSWSLLLLAWSAAALAAARVEAVGLVETPSLRAEVAAGRLPAIDKRVPSTPSVVRFTAADKRIGRHGGALNTLIRKAKDVKMMTVYGYARLVGYSSDLEIVPDILLALTVKDGRAFTLELRPGHRWSDGHPFTAEDFRYWWEEIGCAHD